jgi:hypothetical protein
MQTMFWLAMRARMMPTILEIVLFLKQHFWLREPRRHF